MVKAEILDTIKSRLSPYNILVDTISITDFKFSDQFVKAVESKVEAQQRALQAQNDLQRIQIEAQQTEAKAIGDQKGNVAQAEGIKQSNVLRAQGESQVISIIDKQLHNSTIYLDWLKAKNGMESFHWLLAVLEAAVAEVQAVVQAVLEQFHL